MAFTMIRTLLVFALSSDERIVPGKPDRILDRLLKVSISFDLLIPMILKM